MKTSIHIRRAELQDGPVLAQLCEQLGYAAPPAEVRAHLARHPHQPGHCLLVALVEGVPVGWLEVFVRDALDSGVWAEISGLVVEASRRRQGVGSALLLAARRWAQAEGVKRLRVRTRVEREGAARFYAREGFRLTKQQRVYDLDL